MHSVSDITTDRGLIVCFEPISVTFPLLHFEAITFQQSISYETDAKAEAVTSTEQKNLDATGH